MNTQTSHSGVLAAASLLICGYFWPSSFGSIVGFAGGLIFLLFAQVVNGVAVDTATEYGYRISAAFDTCRIGLLRTLGYDCPAEPESEKILWQQLDQAFFYHRSDQLPMRSRKTIERKGD